MMIGRASMSLQGVAMGFQAVCVSCWDQIEGMIEPFSVTRFAVTQDDDGVELAYENGIGEMFTLEAEVWDEQPTGKHLFIGKGSAPITATNIKEVSRHTIR